jgi:hypothetical protein
MHGDARIFANDDLCDATLRAMRCNSNNLSAMCGKRSAVLRDEI